MIAANNARYDASIASIDAKVADVHAMLASIDSRLKRLELPALSEIGPLTDSLTVAEVSASRRSSRSRRETVKKPMWKS